MYITISGCQYYMGIEAFQVGQVLTLVKDPENKYDDEAIKVVSDGNVTYGYVSNSVSTVARGTSSAGRIYDIFDKELKCRVMFITEGKVIAEILKI